ncbi:class I SAM-dependent methyltransferase [Patescibacteria group bacterium]
MNQGTRKEYFRIFLEKLPAFQAVFRAIEAEGLKANDLVEPILDLGCGQGTFTEVVVGKEKTIVGVDIDQKELAQAEKKGFYQKLVKADARHLPFKNKEFQSVLSNSVLEHVKDLKPVLKEIHRVLAKSGTLVFTAPSEKRAKLYPAFQILNWLGLLRLARIVSQGEDKIFKHLNCWSGNQWCQTLKNIGFKKVEYEYRGGVATNWLSDFLLIFAPIAFLEKKIFGRLLGWRCLTAGLVFSLFGKVEDQVKNENGSVVVVRAQK